MEKRKSLLVAGVAIQLLIASYLSGMDDKKPSFVEQQSIQSRRQSTTMIVAAEKEKRQAASSLPSTPEKKCLTKETEPQKPIEQEQPTQPTDGSTKITTVEQFYAFAKNAQARTIESVNGSALTSPRAANNSGNSGMMGGGRVDDTQQSTVKLMEIWSEDRVESLMTMEEDAFLKEMKKYPGIEIIHRQHSARVQFLMLRPLYQKLDRIQKMVAVVLGCLFCCWPSCCYPD